MGLVFTNGELAAGNLASHMAAMARVAWSSCVPCINGTVRRMPSSGKTPWVGEQARLPGQSTQAGAECLNLGKDASFPYFWLFDLFIVGGRANAGTVVNICSGVFGAATVKDPTSACQSGQGVKRPIVKPSLFVAAMPRVPTGESTGPAPERAAAALTRSGRA